MGPPAKRMPVLMANLYSRSNVLRQSQAVAQVLFRHGGCEAAFWRDVDPEMQLRESSGVWSGILTDRAKVAEKQHAENKNKVSARRQLKMAKIQPRERPSSGKRHAVSKRAGGPGLKEEAADEKKRHFLRFECLCGNMQRGDKSKDNLASGLCNPCITDKKRDGKEYDKHRHRLETCCFCKKKAQR